jgi:NhaP-type Na+/H+ or K+/H+ antiporter
MAPCPGNSFEARGLRSGDLVRVGNDRGACLGGAVDLAILLYAVLSLTVVRMLPVALAVVGAGLDRATVLFVGWFGPRGLASLVSPCSRSRSSVPVPTPR